MITPRWKKLARDLQVAQGRMWMIVVAIAISISAVGAILSAYAILTREISRNYLGTNPASALLEVDGLDAELVRSVRNRPDIADAEAGAILSARVEVAPDHWLPMTIFVAADLANSHINTVQPQTGEWPPPTGSLLLEREALSLAQAKIGSSLRVQVGNKALQTLRIAGTVHDPGLAPAWQEQTVYAYATPATLALLTGNESLTFLKIVTKNNQLGIVAIEETTRQLAGWLQQQGKSVGEIRVPPADRHPHQGQMNAILLMFVLFSLLALVLSAILTATLIGGLLAEQVRQIGIMKAIGARTQQISALYLALVAGLGVVAVIVGIPLGLAAGRGLAGVVAQLLNFTLDRQDVPLWVFVTQAVAGILLPVAVTFIPIRRFTQTTVRQSLQDFGVSEDRFGKRSFDAWLGKLRLFDLSFLLALRNVFRRRSRLLLTLSLLAMAGAVFLTALNVRSAWERNLADARNDRRYDMEIRLNQSLPEKELGSLVATVKGVAAVEPWSFYAAAPWREDQLDIVRTYPDGGHASFTIRSMPANSKMVHWTVLAGRLLQPGETGTVVLNHTASGRFPEAQVGQNIRLIANKRVLDLRVVGIVRELSTPSAAYVTPETFASSIAPAGETNALRIVFASEGLSQEKVAQAIEQKLSQNHINVKLSIPEAVLEEAVNGHSLILIFMLLVMALIMGIVGMLGLASAIGTSVIERTREFGVMRAIGARSTIVQRNVMMESVSIGLMSWAIAIVLSLPLSLAVGRLVGGLAFGLPLPLVASPQAIAIWLLLVSVGALFASLYPARKAAKLTVRETLAYV